MLPKHLKLDLRSEKNFFSSCKKNHSQYFSFFYRKNEGKGLRVVVIIPKKTVRLATERNKVKRKIYSIINEVIKNSKNPKEITEKNINLAIVVNRKSVKEKAVNLVEIIKGNLIEIKV